MQWSLTLTHVAEALPGPQKYLPKWLQAIFSSFGLQQSECATKYLPGVRGLRSSACATVVHQVSFVVSRGRGKCKAFCGENRQLRDRRCRGLCGAEEPLCGPGGRCG